MPDPKAVNSMFGRIARRYDIANLLLSFGIDRIWRKQLVREVARQAPQDILDLATGSGDVAFALSRRLSSEVKITGMDFCAPMLNQARAKLAAASQTQYANIEFRIGDGLAIPLPDGCCDTVTVSFGLRNMADRPLGLREMRRVLRPHGKLFILEFSQPSRWFRPFYYFYLRHILPIVAGAVTGDRAAYVYLNDTIAQFPDREALADEIAAAGFARVEAKPMTFGIVALHAATR